MQNQTNAQNNEQKGQKKKNLLTFLAVLVGLFFIFYTWTGYYHESKRAKIAEAGRLEREVIQAEAEKEQAAMQAKLDSLIAVYDQRKAATEQVFAERDSIKEEVAELRIILASDFSATFVHHGESLWKIADMFLGDPFRWPELYACNVPAIGDNPHLIYPMTYLVFPPDTSP
jgi:nucleoid-associated protein YgaU